MSLVKPKKYLPINQKWRNNDVFETCEQQVYICPKCNNLGHYTENLRQWEYKYIDGILHLKLIKYILHSHFNGNTDIGRHVRCKIGYRWISIHDPDIKQIYVYRPRNPPKWVMEDDD